MAKGDIITDLTKLDDGWLFGTSKSTGKMGMLPANYVTLKQLDLDDVVVV